MNTILVVEDEPRLRGVVARLIEAAGFAVTSVGTGADALREAVSGEFDLVVLDLGLPDISGRDVLRALRAARPRLRVLILSSMTSVGVRVELLEGGAADFVAKPFVAAELLARIRLRISADGESERSAPASDLGQVPVTHDAYLDLQRQELCLAGARIPLSQREFGLLAHLVNRRGKVCTREELLADVWGIGFDPGTNVVDVYVRRLRHKLSGDLIETVRNVGYRLAAG